MRQGSAFAGAILAAWLSGCAPTPIRPGPAPLPASPVVAAPTFQRAAYAGTRQRLDFLTALSPDCSYMGPSTYHFLVRARHGVVRFTPARQAPAFLPNNIHFKCNDRRVPGRILYYTPDRGYAGIDRFVIEWISPDGCCIAASTT